jgi:sodium-coupled neutral amino acid transporter 11
MLTTLPLEAFVCRSVMTTYYFPDEPHNTVRHVTFTTALVVTSMVLSLITCDLGSVFELIGATSAAALAYIFPPLCYIKLSSATQREKIPAYFCICFGVLVMGVSVVQAVIKIIRSKSVPRNGCNWTKLNGYLTLYSSRILTFNFALQMMARLIVAVHLRGIF